ncbi:hypothetical protein BDZ89DRAFT_663976 [Hymenopellis radicata]|nr:hypothetical protein BDZ89DRAFT_663976 [Hymenopellis radicata]
MASRSWNCREISSLTSFLKLSLRPKMECSFCPVFEFWIFITLSILSPVMTAPYYRAPYHSIICYIRAPVHTSV